MLQKDKVTIEKFRVELEFLKLIHSIWNDVR